jgi:7,8-dihydropterin-6-yl-methyl-4-(beta-D-ribofuranosyl)aminobenzene 5'-phosphate synthase
LLGAVLVAVAVVLARFGLAALRVAQTPDPSTLPDLGEMGETDALAILPLYENAKAAGNLVSGHGVSYLIRTDEATILMDLGFNPDQEAQAPLVTNMARLGIAPDEADLLVISHNHPDHVGGLRRQPAQFKTASGVSALPAGARYAPASMDFAGAPFRVAEEPGVVAPGVATLGRMPFVQPFPFWLWQPLNYEQALAVNVAGEGIVVITGCGHPTLERIVARAEALFAEPVVGIVGGLHYGDASADEVAPHIRFLDERAPRLVALSPHDSMPAAIDAFRQAFPNAYRPIAVGRLLEFGAPADTAAAD